MDVTIVREENGKKFNKWDMEIVDCGLCGRPTTKTGTKRCDRCWELETRIKDDLTLSKKIIAQIESAKIGVL